MESTAAMLTGRQKVAQRREVWPDRLKGILILSVVIGHILPGPYNTLDNPASYIFLFHLPAFFIVSGYLARGDTRSFGQSIFRRTRRILVPYIVYVLLIAGGQIVYDMFHGYNTKRYLGKKISGMLLGGQDLNQFFCGALWFLTAMFVASVLFYAIEKLLPNPPLRIAAYLLLWISAHVEAIWFVEGTGPTPWLWDVGIIGCCYMGMGKYLKDWFFHKYACIASAAVLALLLTLRLLRVSDYLNGFAIELWSHTNKYPVLDFVVPLAGFILLANLAKRIPARYIGAALSDIGRYTIPIMALHQSVIQILLVNGITNYLVLWVAAAAIPYLIGKLVIDKVEPLRFLLM